MSFDMAINDRLECLKFAQSMSLHNFGSKSDSFFIQTEKFEQVSLRINHKGSRKVALCNCWLLSAMMRRMGVTGSSPVDFMKEQREVGISTMQAGGVQAFATTLAFHQCLFVPAGWLVAEQTLGEDVIGLKYSCILPRDAEHMKCVVAEMKKASTSNSSTCKIVQTIVEAPRAAARS